MSDEFEDLPTEAQEAQRRSRLSDRAQRLQALREARRQRIKKARARSKELRDLKSQPVAQPLSSHDDFEGELLRVAERGDHEHVAFMAALEFPLDGTSPRSRQTALHIAAGNGARATVMALLESEEIDHLVRDAWGRLPSDLAYLYANDPALSRLLAIKERKQSRTQGVALL